MKVWIFLFSLATLLITNPVIGQKKQENTLTASSYLKKNQKDSYKKLFYQEFINIKELDSSFVLDIRYATENNFLKQAVYECGACFLLKETAYALAKAQKEFRKMGLRIKIFDCYRPLSVQKKMWRILPGTHYVANPAKGSKHNKGAAVDVTLVNNKGEELDMGTAFDYFGKEAHHNYTGFSKEILDNRKLLKEVLHNYNFKSIFSEWWHYEYRPQLNEKVKDLSWDCP